MLTIVKLEVWPGRKHFIFHFFWRHFKRVFIRCAHLIRGCVTGFPPVSSVERVGQWVAEQPSSGGGWAVRWQQTGRARGGLEGGPGQAPPLPRSPPWPRKASCSDLHWQNIKGRPDKEPVAGLSGKSEEYISLFHE